MITTTIDQLYPDIWYQVFEYFSAMELFFSLLHVTVAADQVLLDNHSHFTFQGLLVDVSVQTLPEKLSLSRLISLELHEESSLDIIERCSTLRSLKLIGQSEWVLCLLRRVLKKEIKLERLMLVVPGVGSLHQILALAESIFSLRRLEIYANEFEEKIQTDTLQLIQTKIEQFIFHSCSSNNWSDYLYLLRNMSNIHLLDISLFQEKKDFVCSFSFPKLRYVRLTLVEVSFEWIIHFVKITPLLRILRLHGLVDSEGFVVRHKWISLFELCASLNSIIVNVSLEQDTNSFRSEIIQTALREINLHLTCLDDDNSCYLTEENRERWWSLSGTINKYHSHIETREEICFP